MIHESSSQVDFAEQDPPRSTEQIDPQLAWKVAHGQAQVEEPVQQIQVDQSPQAAVQPEQQTPAAPQTEAPVQFVEPTTQTQFDEYVKEYDNLPPDTVKYILEGKQQELAQKNPGENPFSAMSDSEAAALLLAVEKSTRQPVIPQATGTAAAETQPASSSSEALDQLRTRVLSNRAAAELYFPEQLARLSISDFMQEVNSLALALTAEESISPVYFRCVVESSKKRQAEVLEFVSQNPEGLSALQEVTNEWKKREQNIAAITELTEEIDQATSETIDDASEIETKLGNNTEILSTERTDAGLVVTVTEENATEEKKILVKEPNIWKLVFIAAITKALIDTDDRSLLGELWTEHNVVHPLLTKLGVNPAELSNLFAKNNYDASNGMLRVINSKQCEEYFLKVIDREKTNQGVLFSILESFDPVQLQKIFNPNGTQTFGGTSFLEIDHLNLPSELVKKMYEGLTERQRIQLRLSPPNPAQNQPQG